MKRTALVGLVATIALLLIGSIAYAHWRGHDGMRGAGYGNAANSESFAKFKDEAASLRGQLFNKRNEILTERHKPAPDSGRIAQLREEMTGLRAQIHSIAEKHGVNAGYFCGAADCPTGGKYIMGRGRHGQGMHRQGMATWNCPLIKQQ